MNEQHAVFLGNLDDSTSSSEDVAEMIGKLIHQASGLTVELSAIHIRRSVPSRCLVASICTSSQVEQRRILEALKNNTGNMRPAGLVKNGRKLKVDIFKPTNRPETNIPDINLSNRHSYVKGQQLGNETRILEFKRGGGEDPKVPIRRHVAKYMCAFLNGEGGSLMIGVDDSGFVQGVYCDRKQEDNVRINIDDIVQKFDPPVLPQTYQLNFIPVKNESGLKVIEICVNAGRPNTLYETPNGDVFIRRDGSVRGPLRAREIQEWCRLKFANEFSTSEGALQQKMDSLQERLQKLESAHDTSDKHDTEKNEKPPDESTSPTTSSSNSTPTSSLTSASTSASTSSSNKRDIKRSSSTVCTIL